MCQICVQLCAFFYSIPKSLAMEIRRNVTNEMLGAWLKFHGQSISPKALTTVRPLLRYNLSLFDPV